MNELLLSETLGEDTTTQLYRDATGAYRVRVMALPDGGGERVAASRSPRVFQDRPVGAEQARALFGVSSAQRYVDAATAFPSVARPTPPPAHA